MLYYLAIDTIQGSEDGTNRTNEFCKGHCFLGWNMIFSYSWLHACRRTVSFNRLIGDSND
jgi:hypothetical protein